MIMRITNIKKSGNKYKIEFSSGRSILTFDNVILDNNLLYDKKIDDSLYDKIVKETSYYGNYNDVLKKISRKMMSEEEVKRLLVKKDVSLEDIEKIINKLKEINLINDRQYALAYTNDRINLSMDGPYKIKRNLEENKIDDDIIMEALEVFSEDIINEKIKKIIDKKLKNNTKDTNYIFRQKVSLYLSNLGYGKENIVFNLDNVYVDNKNLEREMEKIFDKLKDKYDGYILKSKLKQKLFSKGFTNEEIADFINKNSSLI